jgi:hypothetical protein
VQLLRRTDLEGHTVGQDETRRWPALEGEVISRLGLLRRIEDAEYATCEACPDAPYAEVISEIGPESRIYCGQHGLMRVAPERLQQWEVDFEAVGRLVVAQLGLTGGIQVVIPGRIWLLGRRQVAGRTTEFFLVQGIAWPDCVEVLRAAPKLAGSPAPIIVCPDQLPEQPEWRESGRVFFRLSEWTNLKAGALEVDFEAFADLYRQAAETFHEPLEPTPIAQRDSLIKRVCKDHDCTVAQLCRWAKVDPGDLSRWKNGSRKKGKPLIPDGGDRATRIEKLLQRGYKTCPD